MVTDPRYPQAIIEPGAQISAGCNLAAGSHIGSQVRLAPNVVIGRDVRLHGEVHLGQDVIIGQNCSLFGPLQIDEAVVIAPHVQIGSSLGARTRIRIASRIGCRSVIMGGVSIGQNSFIRSCSHVIGDVPDYALVSGDPAFLEDYVCSRCASRFSVVRSSPNHLMVYLQCRNCGLPVFTMSSANFLPRIAHVLLPGQTPGQVVNLTGHSYTWVDVYEMKDFQQPQMSLPSHSGNE